MQHIYRSLIIKDTTPLSQLGKKVKSYDVREREQEKHPLKSLPYLLKLLTWNAFKDYVNFDNLAVN